MDNSNPVFETLDWLTNELLLERFTLQRLNKDEKEILKLKTLTQKRIKEIKQRIDYNVKTHGTTLRERGLIEPETEEDEEDDNQ